ncbi:MAG: hypothetical protein BWX84_00027 [Verrucomicrobia bacterium ADurb.Bin118]|jgi:hypothetical protein|nr:MAG: hypothetical protein BWX84_00027 [Verrucomicrobia bacterium ADurb.Bin118]
MSDEKPKKKLKSADKAKTPEPYVIKGINPTDKRGLIKVNPGQPDKLRCTKKETP